MFTHYFGGGDDFYHFKKEQRKQLFVVLWAEIAFENLLFVNHDHHLQLTSY